MSSSSKDVNASEALLLEAIRKVKPYQKIEGISEPYNDLKEILHILRGNKLKGGGARGRVLNYDVCDVVELARDLIDCYTGNDMLFIAATGIGDHLWRCVGGVKTCMLLSESTMTTTKNIVGEVESSDGENVVGLEDVIERLLAKEIFCEEPALSRLVIDGMTGLGKTALVRKLYSHTRVVDKFERRAWLRVPSDFSHKGVLMNLIQQVVDSNDDDDALQEFSVSATESAREITYVADSLWNDDVQSNCWEMTTE